ncbi:spoIIIJ-associated protein [Actinobaculum suis]|uniref:R3H domain-containing nucleic acid-binding protein n=1 Tax=Actinobaculum suis TaxID=1657 RepID=A0A0K9ESM1_9ACTO|nr:R3H domain-containing nucleic acid-binding protein [Actinobaculum suis]KMY23178.1 single-stranded DNA-binding protein [Actinobaculum suis]MDY5152695.1 R3H domain-containing nucleic acid-binding protein [Actinobaculum suis]OCA95077.1 single-stranded DNA-binding protein [Actinobaculum suis]OCA95791.1 single-stranded DNA-binding protein [Actinobaculum suis]SDE09733.1 spoIIIJ-associated protein [Actinobaculum suis]
MSEVPAKEPNLDKEGDLAADYLEELLDIADLDGDIEISVDRDRATVAIVTEGEADSRLRRLIGKHGEGVNALQSLTRLAVQQQTGERSRLMVDIAGYRQERREKVSELAEQAIQEVIDTGDEIELDPMNPFERKVVHDAVAAAGLLSDSEGYGSHRHVVIKPADDEYGEYEIVSDEDDDEYDDYDEHEDSAASAESAD